MSILDELRAREPLFHRRELGTTRADFERMTAPDFWEIGASGRRYDRAFVLDELEKRYSGDYTDDLQLHDFAVTELGGDCWLATYTLIQDGTRVTRRATIWRGGAEDGWVAVYHQGTIVVTSPAPAPPAAGAWRDRGNHA